jgi:hypothetical protein
MRISIKIVRTNFINTSRFFLITFKSSSVHNFHWVSIVYTIVLSFKLPPTTPGQKKVTVGCQMCHRMYRNKLRNPTWVVERMSQWKTDGLYIFILFYFLYFCGLFIWLLLLLISFLFLIFFRFSLLWLYLSMFVNSGALIPRRRTAECEGRSISFIRC